MFTCGAARATAGNTVEPALPCKGGVCSARRVNHKDTVMYREYQPIAETLDRVWRYDPNIFGKKWRDWRPNTMTPCLLSHYLLN